MATAKKLASGSWRCQVYSHTEEVIQPDGSVKKKRIYKSFTCTTPGAKGKRECERMAAEWAVEKEYHTQTTDILLSEAYDKYISLRSAVISPATLREYSDLQRKICKGLCPARFPNSLRKWSKELSMKRRCLTLQRASETCMAFYLRFLASTVQTSSCGPTCQTKPVHPFMFLRTKRWKLWLNMSLEHKWKFRFYWPLSVLWRRSEICALTSDQIDGNIVHINQAMVLNENQSVGRQKNPRAMPEIAISHFQILLLIK